MHAAHRLIKRFGVCLAAPVERRASVGIVGYWLTDRNTTT